MDLKGFLFIGHVEPRVATEFYLPVSGFAGLQPVDESAVEFSRES